MRCTVRHVAITQHGVTCELGHNHITTLDTSVLRHDDECMTRRLASIATGIALVAGCASIEQDDHTPAWVPNGYAPCTQEDSPGPCYWDAKHRSNGQGTSFYVTPDQSVVYVYTN